MAATNVALAGAIIVLRVRSERRDERRAAVDAEWHPRLFSLIAGDTDPEALADDVPEGHIEHVLELCARFAQRLTGSDLRRLERFAERHAWRPARQLTQADVETRARSVMLLSAIGGRRYEHALLTALDDPDPMVAMVAAQAVARRGLADQVPRILERVAAMGVWSPAFVARIVASFGSAASPPLLGVLADSDRSSTERSTAALALAQLHDPRAADVAVRVLLGGEDDRDLVTACLRIVEEVGRPTHLSPIRRLLAHQDFAIRARAAAALGSMGTTADAARLVPLVADPSRWVALNAAIGLRKLHRDDLLRTIAAEEGPASPVAVEALELEVVA